MVSQRNCVHRNHGDYSMGKGIKAQNSSSCLKSAKNSPSQLELETRGEKWRRFFTEISASNIHEIGNLILCLALAVSIVCVVVLSIVGLLVGSHSDNRLLLMMVCGTLLQLRRGTVKRATKSQ